MTAQIFETIFAESALTLKSFSISLAAALLLGAFIAFVFGHTANESKGFLCAIAMLPPIVALTIMMVNGSLGASVAIAGAFSLVRFRSNPGTAREICAVFFSMSIGLACGIGYPGFAALFALVISLADITYEKFGFILAGKNGLHRTLNITLPEDLDYGSTFDDIFSAYTKRHALIRIKTTNLGSLNRLTYDITLAEGGSEKALIDELRCRNGNLEISISVAENDSAL